MTDMTLNKDKLLNNELFKNSKISESDLNKLEPRSIDLEKGEFLFHQDEQANSIYLIIDGEINLIKKQGSKRVQSLFSKNSFLGHEEYFLNTKRNSTAVAIKDSYIVELSKENIETLLSQKNSVLNTIKDSIHALEMVSTNKLDKANHELTDRPEKKNSFLPMELKTNNKKYTSIPKDKAEIPESQISDYNKVDSKEGESGISKIISKLNEDLALLDKERSKIQSTVSAYESNNQKLSVEIERLRKQESKYINLDKEKNEILGWQSYRIIELEKETNNSKKLELEYKEKIDSLLRQEAKNRVNIQKIESELQKQNKIISELETSLEENKKTIVDLEEINTNLLKEKANQNQLIETQEANLKNSAEKIEVLKFELSEKEICLNELNDVIKNNASIISEQNNNLNIFKSENDEQRLLLNKKNEESRSLSTKLNALQNQLGAQKEKEKRKDEFILNQSHKISENENTLKSLEKELSRKEKIINRFIEDIGEFARDVWHDQNEINKQESIINKFIDDIGEFARDVWHDQNEINKQQSIINKFIEDIGEFAKGVWHKQNEINSQADTINKLNIETEELKKLNNDLLNKETNSNEKISNLKSQLTKARNDLSSISANDKEKTEELETKKKEITELKDQLLKYQNEASDFKIALHSKDDQINNLEVEISQLKNEITDQTGLQKLKDDLNSVSAQLSQKHNETTELNNEKNSLLEKINNLERAKEKEIEELNAQVARFQEELSETKTVSQSKDEKINNLKSEIAQLKNVYTDPTELQKLKDDLHSASAQLSQKNNVTSQLNNEKNKLLEKINSLEQAKEEETAKLNAQVARFQEELSETKSFSQSKDEKINNLENEIAQLKNEYVDPAELQRLKDDLNSVSAQLSQKDKESSELNDEKNTFLEKINKLELAKEKETTELNTQVEKFQKELNDAKAALHDKDEQINNLEKSLEHDLNSASIQLSEKEKENLELSEERDKLLEKINGMEQIIKENENQDNGVLQELKEELNNSRIDVEESKNEVVEKEKIIEQLRNDLEKLESTKSEVIKILTVAKKSYQDKIKAKDVQISNLTQELEQIKNQHGENQEINKTEQITETDLSVNELSTDNEDKNLEKKDIVTADSNEDVFKNDTTNDDDEILSKSKFIASAPSDSFNDNSLQCVKYNDIYIVNINLSRATMQDALPLSNFLSDLINSYKNNFIINLTKCEYIDSSVLGALVNALKKATTNGVDLRIVWPDQGEYSMLHLTRMDKIFQIFNSLKQAVESYQ